MAFTRTTTPPATNAPVTVTFGGLMLLRPGQGRTCEIGVHRSAQNHAFQIILIVLKADRPPTLIRLHTGYLDGPVTIRCVSTDIAVPDPAPDFQAYAATADPLARTHANALAIPLDYRWGLNMKEYYPAQTLDFNEDAKPPITVDTGVLYTRNLSHREFGPVLKKAKPSPTEIPLSYLSADLAAAITPPANTNVKIGWSELGNPWSIELPREYDDPQRTTYTVSFINDPPNTFPAPHEEMRQYYNVLTVDGQLITDPNYQWRLAHNEDESTDRIPCMPIVLEP
jgi:hypothetical protein